MSKWQWILRQLGNRLWLRAGLFCLLAIFTALAAVLLKDFIPTGIPQKVGANAVDNILQIIASSMLAVTTFSLSTMVAAYSAATSNVTPRSTQLLLQDRTAQNALSVFIGAFLYSLVGIIALSMEVYGESGRLVLFIATILVIALIVGVLLRWISYLSRLGRVSETIDMVEKATLQALKQRLKHPYLGGKALKDYTPKRNHQAICCAEVGYIQHVDIGVLSRLATKAETTFYLDMTPGSFNDSVRPLLYSAKKLDEETEHAARNAFSIGDCRSFEQDCRYGMVVLSEIASRALSPAVNDPGTAIDIIGTAVRTLQPWMTHRDPAPEPSYPNIHVPPLHTSDLLDDLFSGLARDGAAMLEVGVRLQKAFASLAAMSDSDMKKEVWRHSDQALEYAQKKLTLSAEKDRIATLAKAVQSGKSVR